MLHIFSPAQKSTYETKRKNYALLLRSKLIITKIEDYKNFFKNLRLLKLKITKILHNCNSSTKHSYNTVQRTQIATVIRHYFWLTKQTHRFYRGFLSQAIMWFATDRNVQRRKSGTPTKRVNWLKRFTLQLIKRFTLKQEIWLKRFTLQLQYNKLSSISMLKIF